MKKKICVCVPCFNEEDNVIPLAEEVMKLFDQELPQYDYTIQFIDNHSDDKTRERLEELCQKYPDCVRAIFNSRNFKGNSALYGLLHSCGDCAVYLSADFQDPIEKIPELLQRWEEGYLIVAALKKTAQENPLKYRVRGFYYKLMHKYSEVGFIEQFCNFGVEGYLIVAALKKTAQENPLKYRVRGFYYKLMHKYSEVGFIEQFCNFGVYDKKFLDIIRGLKNPNYSIRGNVAEYGYNICYVEYEQHARRSGYSKYNVFGLFNIAITNFIDYTDILLKAAVYGYNICYVEYEQHARRSGYSKYNVFGLFNIAITNFIDYTDILLKAAVFIGGFGFFVCFIIAIIFLIRKLLNWSEYAMGVAPILIGVFFVGALNMFLLGIIGEYILSVRKQVKDSPLVIEEKRMNFHDEKQDL